MDASTFSATRQYYGLQDLLRIAVERERPVDGADADPLFDQVWSRVTVTVPSVTSSRRPFQIGVVVLARGIFHLAAHPDRATGLDGLVFQHCRCQTTCRNEVTFSSGGPKFSEMAAQEGFGSHCSPPLVILPAALTPLDPLDGNMLSGLQPTRRIPAGVDRIEPGFGSRLRRDNAGLDATNCPCGFHRVHLCDLRGQRAVLSRGDRQRPGQRQT